MWYATSIRSKMDWYAYFQYVLNSVYPIDILFKNKYVANMRHDKIGQVRSEQQDTISSRKVVF
jgi:hypothetical protein